MRISRTICCVYNIKGHFLYFSKHVFQIGFKLIQLPLAEYIESITALNMTDSQQLLLRNWCCIGTVSTANLCFAKATCSEMFVFVISFCMRSLLMVTLWRCICYLQFLNYKSFQESKVNQEMLYTFISSGSAFSALIS